MAEQRRLPVEFCGDRFFLFHEQLIDFYIYIKKKMLILVLIYKKSRLLSLRD